MAAVQTIQGANRANYGYRSTGNGPGSIHIGESLDAIAREGRDDTGQEVYMDRFGLTRQNDVQTIMRSYIPDYGRDATNNLAVYEEGQYATTYVYGLNGILSQKTSHYDDTHPMTSADIDTSGDYTNIYSDNAVAVGTLYHHQTYLGSSDYTTDATGEVRSWADYDVWGAPKAGVDHDLNIAVVLDTAAFTGYTYDAVLDVWFAQFRFYDAASRRFTQEDPVKDGRNWYAYCGDDPVNWVDPWGLFMSGMVLQVGARGEDVGLLRDKMIGLGSYDFNNNNLSRYFLDYNYFDEGLQMAVEDYYNKQLAYFRYNEEYRSRVPISISPLLETLAKRVASGDYRVDGTLWRYLGLTMNETLQDEFWFGTINPKNDTLKISITGNKVTINYFPKIYAFYEGDKDISRKDYKDIVDKMIAGFKMWEGSYSVFGASVDVEVNVDPTRVYSYIEADILLDTDNTGSWIDRSLVPTTVLWQGRNSTPVGWLNMSGEISASKNGVANRSKVTSYLGTDTYAKIDPISHTAMHEFGHMLGLFDAYENAPFTIKVADGSRAEQNDVMLNLNAQKIYGYNIAMMLYAYKTNNIQHYGNVSRIFDVLAITGVESEAFFRLEKLI